MNKNMELIHVDTITNERAFQSLKDSKGTFSIDLTMVN